MNVLRSLFILLAAVSVFCAVKGIRCKRPNVGFIIMAFLISGCDVLYCLLLGAKSARDASNILMPYYILHSWMLFFSLLMVFLIDRYRRFFVLTALSAACCIYQTWLVICQYRGARIFSFSKRMFFRKAWFVATDSKNTGLTMSFRSYRLGMFFNTILIVIALIICIAYTQKIFRAQYYSFIGILAVYFIIEFIIMRYNVPVWAPGIIYSPISLLSLYLINVFPGNRLREWSLDSFANDMSDGLILYDRYNDLIHVNDMIKDTLDFELVESFREKSALEKWIDGRKLVDMSTIRYEKDGKTSYYNVSVKELGARNKKIGTLFILHDSTNTITRIREVERTNAELERISRMKSDFIANMSHELHTPMNAVIGMTDIAINEKDPEKLKDSLKQIRRSENRLLRIISDILDYSKLESGNPELMEIEFSPYDRISDLTRQLYEIRGDKDIKLSVAIQTPLAKKLAGDAEHIHLALMNLAENAIKFTSYGSVTVGLGCIVNDDSAELVCSVKDTGIGIRKEDIGKIFDSFSQIDSGRSRSADGTGLGLAVSQGYIRAMGGTLEVCSEYGVGSEFVINVPLKVIDPETDERSLPLEGEELRIMTIEKQSVNPFRADYIAPEAKVLVVDDNEINITIASGLMAPLKIFPDKALGGREAVDMVMAKDYDIVFMDHMMPEMDGAEATRIIRSTPGHETKPVIIALSANTTMEARNLFMECGMCDFVRKPVDVKLLTDTIKKWLPDELIRDRGEEDEAETGADDEVRVQLDYLDLEGAVKALGSPALYDKIAEEYYRSGADKYAAIIDAYDAGDWEDYTIRVHALKSSSRQIGALKLGDMAEALEKAGKAGDIDLIKSDTRAAMNEYRRLLDDLAGFYPDEDDTAAEKPPMDGGMLLATMDELEAACNELDMDKMEEISDRLKGYSYEAEIAEKVASLRKAITNLDTEACLDLIGSIRS